MLCLKFCIRCNFQHKLTWFGHFQYILKWQVLFSAHSSMAEVLLTFLFHWGGHWNLIIIMITITITITIIIVIIMITLFKSQIILAKYKCSTNWGDCKSNKSNQINQIKLVNFCCSIWVILILNCFIVNFSVLYGIRSFPPSSFAFSEPFPVSFWKRVANTQMDVIYSGYYA